MGGRWAISRYVDKRLVCLVERSYLDNPQDAEIVLLALGLPANNKSLDHYFPYTEKRGRCPTLELLELFSKIGGEIKKEHGV